MILQPIYPVYTKFNLQPFTGGLFVGSAVKDLPINSDTLMQHLHAKSVNRVKKTYSIEKIKYKNQRELAITLADNAKQKINKVKLLRLMAITALVASGILMVGIAIAAPFTSPFPLIILAVLCLACALPANYYTDVLSNKLLRLKKIIAVPKKLYQPTLKLPRYCPKQDLDLEQTRLQVQNHLATKSLKQIAELGWSREQIVDYALLDRVCQIQPEKRPLFYAQCTQLIRAYGKNKKEHEYYLTLARREYERKNVELRHLIKHQNSKKTVFGDLERGIRAVIDRDWKSLVVDILGKIFFGLGSLKDAGDKRERHDYAIWKQESRDWYRRTLVEINDTFQKALNHLEKQYVLVKINIFNLKEVL